MRRAPRVGRDNCPVLPRVPADVDGAGRAVPERAGRMARRRVTTAGVPADGRMSAVAAETVSARTAERMAAAPMPPPPPRLHARCGAITSIATTSKHDSDGNRLSMAETPPSVANTSARQRSTTRIVRLRYALDQGATGPEWSSVTSDCAVLDTSLVMRHNPPHADDATAV